MKEFYGLLARMPTAEQAKTDPAKKEERRAVLRNAAGLVAMDHMRANAGRSPIARKAVNISIAVIVGAQVLTARPDVERIYHTETLDGEQARVGYTLVYTPKNTRTEHEITLVKERGAWRILVFK